MEDNRDMTNKELCKLAMIERLNKMSQTELIEYAKKTPAIPYDGKNDLGDMFTCVHPKMRNTAKEYGFPNIVCIGHMPFDHKKRIGEAWMASSHDGEILFRITDIPQTEANRICDICGKTLSRGGWMLNRPHGHFTYNTTEGEFCFDICAECLLLIRTKIRKDGR